MHLEAITFDIDDTLWDNVPVMLMLEQEMHDWLGERIGRPLDISIEETAARRQTFGATLAGTERYGDVTYVRQQITHQIMLEHGVPAHEATELTEQAIKHMLELRHRVTPFPEVDSLLDSLSQHYRMAVITNGNVDVNRLPLARHFEACFKAGELGMPKPDERIFRHTLNVLGGVDPTNAMHVGDSWQHDVEPSAALGMQVAWIDLSGEPRTLPENVHRLSHVRELPALLERLGQPM